LPVIPLRRDAETRGVDDGAHEQARDETSRGQGDDPTEVDPGDHAPVDGAPVTVAKTNTHGSAGNTLRCGDGELELRSHDDGNGGAKFHGETTRRRHESNAVAQVLHNVVAISPETDNDGDTSEGTREMHVSGKPRKVTKKLPGNSQNPVGHLRLVGWNDTLLPDLVDGGVRADSVCNVVGTVGEGGSRGSHNLHKSVHEFGLVVVVAGAGVQFLDITRNEALLALQVDDITVDTAEESPLDVPEEHITRVPNAFRLGADERLLLGGAGMGTIDLDLTLGGGSLHLGSGGFDIVGADSTASTLHFELLAGKVALVVVADDALEVGRCRGDLAALQEQRAYDDMVPPELPVLLCDHAVHPGNEEDTDEDTEGSTAANDDARNLGAMKVDIVLSTLPDEKHDNQGGRGTEVDGYEHKTPHDRVLPDQNGVLGDEENHGTENTRENG